MSKWTRAMTGAALALAVLLPVVWACGPEFPQTIIGFTDSALTATPRGDFFVEAQRVQPGKRSGLKAIVPETEPADQSAAADASDLAAAMSEAGVASATVQQTRGKLLEWRRNGLKGPVPEGMPEEFTAYSRGASKYHAGDLAGARLEWNALLALPESKRRWRTVWARYMIARSELASDSSAAAEGFAETRTLVAGGFTDSVGLGAASLGWEARALLDMGNPASAIELYLEQVDSGDQRARMSLQRSAEELLRGDTTKLVAAAKDPAARQIITALLVSSSNWRTPDGPVNPGINLNENSKRWVEALKTAGITSVPDADRLAWAAYQANDMTAADRWLTTGGAQGEGTAVGQWIRAKLAMRAGNIDAAAAALAKAIDAFPTNEEWNAAAGSYSDLPWKPKAHAAGELALLKLGRGQFVESMDLLLRGGFWEDAAYLAERVLTVDELKAYVDGTPAPDSDEHSLRYLLARRLTRLGQWKVARPYYPSELQPTLDTYIGAIRDGRDAKRPKADRAASLWEAAKLARHQGMELLGTELAPDGKIWGGSFPLGDKVPERRTQARKPAERKLSPVSEEELKRLAKPPETPDKRFHYRYEALDHAWAAALLMPDGTEELANLLQEAGLWVAAVDPQAADRFYKALVTRCGTTPLGKEAARLHWFPMP